MTWHKYPETKPVEGSGLTLGGCFVRCELPSYKDIFGDKILVIRKISLFHNDAWNDVQGKEAIPFGSDQKVTHYMYINDIPWPKDS